MTSEKTKGYPYQFTSMRGKMRVARVLKTLEVEPMRAALIAQKTFCDESLVRNVLKYLRGEPRRVFICRYDVVNGCTVPIYTLGSEPDAPRKRKTSQERYATLKANPEQYAKMQEAERERRRAARKALPKTEKKRDRRIYDPPLDVQICALLEVPGYTNSQIAAKLDANATSVRTTLRKLREAGTVQRAEHGYRKEWQWELAAKPLPAPVIPLRKPQGIFAALGI